MERVKLKSGVKYREMIRYGGRTVKSPLFSRKTDAVKWKAMEQTKREKAKLYGQSYSEIKRVRLSDFAREWLEAKVKVTCAKSSFKEYNRIVEKKILPNVKDNFLDQIRADEGVQLQATLRSQGHNVGGVNMIFSVFRTIMREAERKELILKNPFRNLPDLKKVKRVPRYWQDFEIRKFLLSCRDHFLYELFVVAINTGLRRGELCGLCWDKVDFTRSMIEVSRVRDRNGLRNTTKSGKVRFVPMNSIVKATLQALYEEKQSDYVFVREDGSPIPCQHLYRYFRQVQLKADIRGPIRFHDLRHTFASQFMMANGNIYDLQKILGHHDTSITQIYAHLAPEHLAKTTEILNFNGDCEGSEPKSNQGVDNLSVMPKQSLQRLSGSV